jgi:hypothetical protein
MPTIFAIPSSPSMPAINQAKDAITSLRSRVLQYFRTPRNIFGLSRKHYGTEHPSHDPEDHVTLQDLCEVSTDATSPADLLNNPPLEDHSFYPYSNQSSFSLGDWYWNQGVQKSQEDFRRLTEIVGNPNFRPDDICSIHWNKMNTILACNTEDDSIDPNDHEWLGEDTGWKCTAISINVPFHRRIAVPGSQSYLTGELYH